MDYPRSLSRFVIKESMLRKASRPRDAHSNKYSHGRVLVIGGSSSYYGAPIMAANAAAQSLAALRVGTGYVSAFVPQKILGTARSLSPNTIIRGLGKDRIVFNQQLKNQIRKADVILLGMGMDARSPAIARKIMEYALKSSKKVIADADAIDAARSIKVKGGSLLITPHDGEFYRFSGIKLSKKHKIKERVEAARKAAKEHKTIILLKGHATIVTDGQRIGMHESKSAALATIGTGDVLAGIIAGYAALGNSLFDAAVAGVYLHARIGDQLFKEKGNHVIATDVIEKIPKILKKYDKK